MASVKVAVRVRPFNQRWVLITCKMITILMILNSLRIQSMGTILLVHLPIICMINDPSLICIQIILLNVS